MFFKKLDMLSPPITLYFKEDKEHSSIFSGILTLIAYILVFISGVYYALDFINKESPKAYFFNRYIEDAGTFPLNSSSMFNFIQIVDTRTNEEVPFDFQVFRAIGFDDVYYEEYMANPNILEEKDHWVYGYCNNSSDTKGIGYLIDFKYYEQSACIRKYYDKNTKKYYNTGEEGFRWPIIKKGCSNPERTYYGLILQRCDKAPDLLQKQGTECKSESQITEYLSKVSLKYELIDHYADMLNYKMPFTKYFYEVTSAIANGIYIVNHLNFNPANMLTHNGIIFDNQVSERSYFFTQNEKHTVDQASLPEGQSLNGCLIGIYFWMQNTLQYYERNYDRLQDVLSDIGGISSIVLTIAYLINILVNDYIILLDTQDFVLSTDESMNMREMSKKPTIFIKAKEIMTPPRRTYISPGRNSNLQDNPDQQSSNYQRLMKDGVEIYQNNINQNEEKMEPFSNIYFKRNNALNSYKRNNNEKKEVTNENNNYNINARIYSRRGIQNYNKNYKKSFGDASSTFKRETNFKNSRLEKKESLEDNSSIQKQNFTWIKFIWYLLSCKTNDKKIDYYETFRAKLISEENIIENYLDIYKLLKINNIQKKTTILEKES